MRLLSLQVLKLLRSEHNEIERKKHAGLQRGSSSQPPISQIPVGLVPHWSP